MIHVIFGNYGNETIALMQWAIEQGLSDCYSVSVDTGWAAAGWEQRVDKASRYASEHGLLPIRLPSTQNFTQLVRDRQQFPGQKYQWCAGMLKGLAVNAWLDSVDPRCQAVVLMGKRRDASRANRRLPEFVAESEHYNDRRLWYPLYAHSELQCQALVDRAGFSWLNHRSLECDPCIHSTIADLQAMAMQDVDKVAALEEEIQQTLFMPEQFAGKKGIEALVEWAKNVTIEDEGQRYHERFDMGCGSPWGCGE